jgi:hypothetical protein
MIRSWPWQWKIVAVVLLLLLVYAAWDFLWVNVAPRGNVE